HTRSLRDWSSDVCSSDLLVAPEWAGPEDVKVGQLVLGLSRPDRSVRAGLGIVAVAGDAWRTPAGGRVDRFIETDLALHSGFSGEIGRASCRGRGCRRVGG